MRNGKIVKHHSLFLLFLLSIAVLSFFFLYPFFLVIVRNFSFSKFIKVLSEAYFYRVLLSNVKQAALSTFFSLLVASVFLFTLMCRDFKGKSIFIRVSYIPFVLPSIVLVLSFVILFGKESPLNINILYSLKAVLVAHTFYNFPIIMHSVYKKYTVLNRNIRDASYTLGASKVYTFFHVTLSELKASILSSCLLVFMYSFSSFAIVLTLGGGVRNTTLEVEIYKNFKIINNKEVGTAYALCSFIIMFLLVMLYIILTRKDRSQTSGEMYKEKKGNGVHTVLSLIVSFLLLLPLLSLFVSLFRARTGRGSLTLRRAISDVCSHYDIFINSFIVAVLSSLIVVSLSFIISEYLRRRNIKDTDAFVFLPLSFSTVALASGWRTLELTNRFTIIIVLSCLHAFLAFPLVYRIVNSAVRSIKESSLLAPLTLGSGEVKAMFMADLPSVIGPIKGAFLLSFASSLGEVSGSLVLSSYSFNTLSSAIYSYISRYNYTSATVVALILCMIILIIYKVDEY